MQQLCYSTLERTPVLTKTEMNIFFLLVSYQEENGLVIGVHYKDFMDEAGFKSRQTFYNVLQSLSRKNFITYTQNVRGDYDVMVLGNEGYTLQEKPDYINLNKKLFHSKAFYQLKSHEKYLLIKLMRLTALNKGKYIRKVGEFIQECMEKMNVTRRVVFQYLRRLRAYFQIQIRDGKFIIRYQGGDEFKEAEDPLPDKKGRKSKLPLPAVDRVRRYLGHVVLRRHKVKVSKEEERDFSNLFLEQYKRTIESQSQNPWNFMNMFLDEYLEDHPGQFNIKYIHTLLRRVLELD